MSSRARIAFVAAPVLVALVGALIAAAGNERDLVWRGNGFAAEAIPVFSGSAGCQNQIDPAQRFDGVRFGVAGERALAGPPVVVTVQRNRRTLARGRLAPGYVGQARRTVKLDRSVSGQPGLRVCFHNRGKRQLLLYGAQPSARFVGEVTVNGRKRLLGLQMDLTREPRSALSMVGTVVERATLQRPSPVGPWLIWLLAAGVLIGAPLAAWAAVRSAGTYER